MFDNILYLKYITDMIQKNTVQPVEKHIVDRIKKLTKGVKVNLDEKKP